MVATPHPALYTAGFHGDTLAYQLEYASSSLDWKSAMSEYKRGVWDKAAGKKSCGDDTCAPCMAQAQEAALESARVLDGAEVAEVQRRSK